MNILNSPFRGSLTEEDENLLLVAFFYLLHRTAVTGDKSYL